MPNELIRISDNYVFIKLDKPEKIEENEVRVGFLVHRETKKILLFIDVVKGLAKNQKQTMAFADIYSNKKTGDKIGLILVDDITFYLDFVITACGYTMLIHELGHFLNDFFDESKADYSKRRNEALKKEIVMDEEYRADELVVRECGIDKFADAIEWMRVVRKNRFLSKNEENLRLALFEFDKRLEHAIEYAKTIE